MRKSGGRLYPDIIGTIASLAEKVPIFIVSNCQSGYIELFMKKTGCAGFITDHLCPGDTGMYKADNITKIAKDHGIKYPVYVGDTIMDKDACDRAGCVFVYARYGFGDVRGCDHVIDSPGEIIELMEFCQ